MPTTIDLGQRVKQKYPGVYDDLPDAEVGQRVKTKYPGSYDEFTDVMSLALKKPALPKRSVIGDIGQGILGVGKGVLSTVTGAESLIHKGLDKATNPLVKAVTGKPGINTPTTRQLLPKNTYTPTNTAQKVGFYGEQIGEFVAAGGILGKVGKAADAAAEATKLPGLIKSGLKLGARAGYEGVATGTQMAAQEGEINKNVKTAAGIGVAFPVAAKGLGVLGGGAKAVSKYVASTLSGVPTAAIEQAFKNPEAVQKAVTSAIQEGGEATAQKIHKQALGALDLLKKARSDAYAENLAKLEKSISYTKNGTMYVKRALTNTEAAAMKGYKLGTEIGVPTKLTTGGIKSVFTRTLKEFGAEGGGLKNIHYDNVALDDAHISKLIKLQDRIYKWTDTTPTGINRLRQVVDSYKVGGINLGSSESKFNKIIGDLRTNLSDYLTERVPQVAELNKQYHTQTEVIDNIVRQLKLGSNDPNTALRKLVNVFNPKSEVYRPVVKELGDKAGTDLMSDIAGLMMAKWTPEGLGKYLTGLISGYGVGTLNPSILPVALAGSPRIVGKTAATLGKASKNSLIKGMKVILPRLIKGAITKATQ